MGALVHRFRVGSFACTTMLDGIGRYPPGMFFLNLPKEQYEPQLSSRGYSSDQMEVPVICLLVQTEREHVLVDTGGRGVVPDGGQLLHHLRNEGIEPEAIDTVVLSHGHGDHIAGNLLDDGTPAFPSARYVILDDEWDFWMSTPSLAELDIDHSLKSGMVAFVQRNLAGIEAQLELVKADTEILRGITVLAAPGHTPGHMALDISSAGERLIFVADAIIDPIDVEHPEACALIDHQPEVMVRTRRRLLELAARERALVSAAHFPFPGLGHVVEHGRGWQWRPVVPQSV